MLLMKIFRIIGKSFKEAFRSIFRNFSLSMASISCTTITLILVAIALVVTYNVNQITKHIEDTLTIVAFVDTNAEDEAIKKMKYEINSLANVDSKLTEYNSKDDIKEQLSEDDSMKEILETLDINPVQATFVVKVKNVKKIESTAKKIDDIEGITSVRYGESVVNKLLTSFEVARNACLIAVIALLIVTLFLNENTIKITIFSRRQEIMIMRLVGTSNIVIKMPFIIEGFVLGILGSIIPMLITIFGYTFLYDAVNGKLFTDLIMLVEPNTIIYLISLVLVLVGGLVGMFGSLKAVRRYLKI